MTNRVDAEYLSVDQAGAMTSTSPWTWRRYAYAGVVPSVKLGSRLLIPRKAILEHIAANTRPKRAELSGGDAA
jgi:hypothetical protein